MGRYCDLCYKWRQLASFTQREEDYYVVTVTRGVEGLHNTEMSVTIIQRHVPPELRGHHQAQISGGGGAWSVCLAIFIYFTREIESFFSPHP